MKKTILTLALVAATAVSSFAQGKVTFGNDSTRLFQIGIPAAGDTNGPISAGPMASGLTLVASLYAGAAGSLALQTSINITGTDFLAPGRMANKAVILTVPGGVAQTFQIVFTDAAGVRPATLNGLATYDMFGVANTYFGTSGLFTATPGTSIAYPFLYQTTAPVSSTWAAGPLQINAVPEPSSMVLAGLGAASLLMFRRRK